MKYCAQVVWVFSMWLWLCFCWHAKNKTDLNKTNEKERRCQRKTEKKHVWMNKACEQTILWLFKLVSLLNSCLAQFPACFFCFALTCPLCLWKVSMIYSAFLHILFLIPSHSLLAPHSEPLSALPPQCWRRLINFQTLIREAKCAVSLLLVFPSSATAFLSSSLGGQGYQGVHWGHGQAAKEEGARRTDRQEEKTVSSEKQKKDCSVWAVVQLRRLKLPPSFSS